jgi:serine/threonine protein kinase
MDPDQFDFVSQCLQIDPLNRSNASALLEHDYLKKVPIKQIQMIDNINKPPPVAETIIEEKQQVIQSHLPTEILERESEQESSIRNNSSNVLIESNEEEAKVLELSQSNSSIYQSNKK